MVMIIDVDDQGVLSLRCMCFLKDTHSCKAESHMALWLYRASTTNMVFFMNESYVSVRGLTANVYSTEENQFYKIYCLLGIMAKSQLLKVCNLRSKSVIAIILVYYI